MRNGKGFGVTTIPFEEIAKFPDVEIDHLDELTATCDSLINDVYKENEWMSVFEHGILDENGDPITFKHSHEMEKETNRYQTVINRPVKEGSTKPVMDGSAACRLHNFVDALVDYTFNDITPPSEGIFGMLRSWSSWGNLVGGGQNEEDQTNEDTGDNNEGDNNEHQQPKRGRKRKKTGQQPKIRKSRIHSQRGKYVVTGITLLKSIGGAREQSRHIDFKAHKGDRDGSNTDYAIIIPLKKMGTFCVWEESHHIVHACEEVEEQRVKKQLKFSKVREILANNPDFTIGIDNCKKKKIRFGQNEMCVFLGNLVHAGAENDTQSTVYRLHVYVSRADISPPDNYTVVPDEVVWHLTQDGALSEDFFEVPEEDEAEQPPQKKGPGRPRKS